MWGQWNTFWLEINKIPFPHYIHTKLYYRNYSDIVLHEFAYFMVRDWVKESSQMVRKQVLLSLLNCLWFIYFERKTKFEPSSLVVCMMAICSKPQRILQIWSFYHQQPMIFMLTNCCQTMNCVENERLFEVLEVLWAPVEMTNEFILSTSVSIHELYAGCFSAFSSGSIFSNICSQA